MNAVVDDPDLVVPLRPQSSRRPTEPSPYRTITDRALALVQVSIDFVCACIALPLSLVILSGISSAPANSLDLLWSNTQRLPLPLRRRCRPGHRRDVPGRPPAPAAERLPRSPRALLRRGVGLCAGAGRRGRLSRELRGREPNATQLVLAALVTVAVISVGRIVMRLFLHSVSTTRVLVVGSGKLAERIALSVQQDSGMTLVGHAVDDDRRCRVPWAGCATCPRCAPNSTCTGFWWPPPTGSRRRRWTPTGSCRNRCTSPSSPSTSSWSAGGHG